jgi:murein DD-endopeptidase MepM/ murein hydrolase activator NlpD
MRRSAALAGALVAAAAVLGGAAGVAQTPKTAASATPGSTGSIVRLAYRALQPGEPLLVVLEADRGVRSATVAFLGETAELRPSAQKDAVFAFLGIDVQAKPGAHVLTVKVQRAGGAVETIRKELLVAGREFPSTKLTLDPNYVTPPASVQGRIKREAELVALAMSVVTPGWLGDGPFIAPHPGPSWSNFGQRRLNNDVLASLHTGLDLRVPFGEPIGAANAGRVVMASDLYLGGKTVIIDHGLGVFSTYGHMSELRVKRGEVVQKGQTVGLCGSTGRSTGPHLHWSVRVLDARVDPEAMLRLPL